MEPREQVFSDAGALAETLADSIAADLRHAVTERGRASLVVSGGRTPVALFEALNREQVPWGSVWITLADERWVEVESSDSNEGLVRRTLLAGPAGAARFVGLKNAAATPAEGCKACGQALAAVPHPYDVLVLGMGDDGHTASLFPRAPQLSAALGPPPGTRCAAIDPVTAPHPRMTLTLPELLDSRRIVLHLVGDTKWEVFQRALSSGPVEELPVRGVLHQSKVQLDVYFAP